METIKNIDKGKIRVTEKKNGKWILNQWVKKLFCYHFKLPNKNLYLMDQENHFGGIKYHLNLMVGKKKTLLMLNLELCLMQW